MIREIGELASEVLSVLFLTATFFFVCMVIVGIVQ